MSRKDGQEHKSFKLELDMSLNHKVCVMETSSLDWMLIFWLYSACIVCQVFTFLPFITVISKFSSTHFFINIHNSGISYHDSKILCIIW